MKMENSKIKIIKYINENFQVTLEIDGSVDLLKSRIIDSIGIVELVCFLEKEFKIQIPFETITYDDLKNVDSMVELIKKKLALN